MNNKYVSQAHILGLSVLFSLIASVGTIGCSSDDPQRAAGAPAGELRNPLGQGQLQLVCLPLVVQYPQATCRQQEATLFLLKPESTMQQVLPLPEILELAPLLHRTILDSVNQWIAVILCNVDCRNW